MKERIEECSVEQVRLVKGEDKDRAREMVSVVAIVSGTTFQEVELPFQLRIS